MFHVKQFAVFTAGALCTRVVFNGAILLHNQPGVNKHWQPQMFHVKQLPTGVNCVTTLLSGT